MKAQTKRVAAGLLGIFLALTTLGPVSVSANSAQTDWVGTDTTGAIVTDENCPIIVEHEQLTFNIPEFPLNDHDSEAEYLEYSASVTAEYTFYNPADYSVTAHLLFPFGRYPSYVPNTRSYFDADLAAFCVLVDDEPVDAVLRNSLIVGYGYHQFELESDLAMLTDGYIEDDFFAPELPVTKYTFQVSGIPQNMPGTPCITLELDFDSSQTRLFANGFCQRETPQGDIRLYDNVMPPSGDSFTIYCIGDAVDLIKEDAFRLYTDRDFSTTFDGNVACIATETMTFKDLALTYMPDNPNVLESDWYNMVVNSLLLSYHDDKYIISSFWMSPEHYIMRWYEYEITLEPGQRITNMVTAPMYPHIDEGYTPAIYTYTYLLSPAQTWTQFGSLDITVNTPYILTESSIGEFQKTDAGYSLALESLPEEELEFVLSTEEDPVRRKDSGLTDFLMLIILIFVKHYAPLCAIVLALFALIILIMYKAKG